MEADTKTISPKVIEEGMTYEAYRSLIDSLLEEGKTTGPNQSEKMTEYTRMNVQRMKRLDKHAELSDSLQEKLKQLDRPLVWLVLTEGWCGDAAQNIPVIVKMAGQSDAIKLRFILRDENLDIMDEYLTNGGRSIPKLICLDADSLEELGSWGPRPAAIQEKAMQWKNDPDISNKEWGEKLHKWYAKNKSAAMQTEFEALVEEWS